MNHGMMKKELKELILQIPNLGEVNVFGWDGDVGFDELVEKVEELFK